MACECETCSFCGGRGSFWVTLDGQWHDVRCDDMGELEYCEECRGSGVEHVCEECSSAMMEEF